MNGSEALLLEEAARTLLSAEDGVRLLPRAAPRDAASETARCQRAFSLGQKLVLERDARAPVDLSPVRRALARVAEVTRPLGAFGCLHAERAAELELEARLVESLGTRGLPLLAAERFPTPPPAAARECDVFVTEALALPEEPAEALHASDDEADPHSLVVRLRARAREVGLSLSVRVSREQLATAATGTGVVSVRPRVLLSARAVERIVTHELLGHALPRARAAYADWTLFRAGTRGAGDDEEGRAILCEQRGGWLGAERRRELALRHVAALGVRAGAEPRDSVKRLVELGAPVARAVEIAVRVHRGGGLAREIVYLPAYLAVRRAFAAEPALERWFERGRVDLATAQAFTRAPPPPACDPTASAGAEVERRSPPAGSAPPARP
jgi:hypothetical protein